MTLDELRDEYRRYWGDLAVGSVCLRIIDYVSKTPPHQLQFLTFRALSEIAGKDTVDYDLVAAANFLSSSRLAIFEAHAMLIDEDEREHELSPEEFAEAKNAGLLIHPETGDPVPDFESHIVPFFAPTEELYRELSHD